MTRKKLVALVLVPAELALAGYTMRDLARRPSSQIRGPKKFWRIVVGIHPGNSVAYWVVGRRLRTRA